MCEDNGLDEVQVVGLHDLLLEVIDFGVPAPGESEEDSVPAEIGQEKEA